MVIRLSDTALKIIIQSSALCVSTDGSGLGIMLAVMTGGANAIVAVVVVTVAAVAVELTSF